MTTLAQRSFQNGEISPSVYARADQKFYAQSLRTCRNTIIQRQGGAANRPGTSLVGEVKDSTKFTRLYSFLVSSKLNYILEFGENYIRFIQNGKYILAASGLPYEISSPYFSSELPQLVMGRAQLFNVKTLTHQNYPPYELTYNGPTSWVLAPVVFGPGIPAPTGVTAVSDTAIFNTVVTGSSVPSNIGNLLNILTSFVPDHITGAFSANLAAPYNGIVATGTVTPAGIITGGGFTGTVTNFAVGATTWLAGTVYGTFTGTLIPAALPYTPVFQITAIDATTGEESLPVTFSYVRGTSTQAIQLSWSASLGLGGLPAIGYKIYGQILGTSPIVYGLIGEVSGTLSFQDTGAVPSGIILPPTFKNPFSSGGNYPATCGMYQQRRWFANTVLNPNHIYGSQIGRMSNFNVSNPTQDDDAVDFGVVGKESNTIQHLLDLRALFIFSDTGEYAIQGGLITPTSVDLKQHSYTGSSGLPPVVVGNLPIFVQRSGNTARNILYDFYTASYKSDDQSINSSHLFEGHTMTDMVYAKVPNSIVWVLRDDGVLLGFTYIPEHEVMGWHHHDTLGTYEALATVPEERTLKFRPEDVLYVIANRTIGGVAHRFVERVETRLIQDVKDMIFMDCASTYDGRGTTVSAGMAPNTMQLSTLTGGWTKNDNFLVSAFWASSFTSAMIGQAVIFTAADGTKVNLDITAVTPPNVLTVRSSRDIPVDLQGTFVPNTQWALGRSYIDGMAYLNGQAVSILADGFVVASPNNPRYPVVTVTGGIASLAPAAPGAPPRWFSVIHAGLPYLSDIQTLDMEVLQGETMMGKNKIVERVNLQLQLTSGLWIGGKSPDDIDPELPIPTGDTKVTNGLIEPKFRQIEDWNAPTGLFTGVHDQPIKSKWNINGRVFIRQIDPVPATILSIAPSGYIPMQG